MTHLKFQLIPCADAPFNAGYHKFVFEADYNSPTGCLINFYRYQQPEFTNIAIEYVLSQNFQLLKPRIEPEPEPEPGLKSKIEPKPN